MWHFYFKHKRLNNTEHKDFLDAYQTIHTSFARYCESVCYGLYESDDLIQEVVLAGLENYAKLKDKHLLLPYLIGIAQNLLKKKIRRKKVVQFFGMDQIGENRSSLERTDWPLELRELHESMQKLSSFDRDILILFEISGFSIKEIAAIHEKKESAIKTGLHRARKRLKKILSDPIKHSSLVIYETGGVK